MDIEEIERIKRESDIVYKTYLAVIDRVKISNEEIDELIKYWEENENYEQCLKLKNLKK